jgi:hypothetical protein
VQDGRQGWQSRGDHQEDAGQADPRLTAKHDRTDGRCEKGADRHHRECFEKDAHDRRPGANTPIEQQATSEDEDHRLPWHVFAEVANVVGAKGRTEWRMLSASGKHLLPKEPGR